MVVRAIEALVRNRSGLDEEKGQTNKKENRLMSFNYVKHQLWKMRIE
jgi:hypothetical protein